MHARIGSYRSRHLAHGLPVLGYLLFATTVSLDPSRHTSACLSQHLLGTPCPFCGLTRSVAHLYVGDYAGAFALHPLGAFFLLVATVLLTYRLTCVIKPRTVRIPLVWELWLYYGVFVLFLMAWLLRLSLHIYA